MKTLSLCVCFVTVLAFSPVHAQEPVVGVADPESLFKSSDPKLNANKQVVYGIFRDLLEANHWELAGKYLTDRYIQHNPNAASGLPGVVKFFTEVMKVQPKPIEQKLKSKIVSVTAEGDLVTRRLATGVQGPEGSVEDLHDDVVRHVAHQGRKSRRTLGLGDEESVDSENSLADKHAYIHRSAVVGRNRPELCSRFLGHGCCPVVEVPHGERSQNT